MKVKVHDWNLPANERIILPLTERNYHLNFIGFLIKPLPSALTCSTTAVNLLPRTGICFSLSTKFFISILEVCEEQRAGTLLPLFLQELFSPLPLLITHNTFALTWLPINYPVSCWYVLNLTVLIHILQVHDVVHTPEGMQPGVKAGPFPCYTDQNIREITSWGDILEWQSVFLSSRPVWPASPSSFTSVISHTGLDCSDTFCQILLLVYFFSIHTQKVFHWKTLSVFHHKKQKSPKTKTSLDPRTEIFWGVSVSDKP